jgi:hypothetical protein
VQTNYGTRSICERPQFEVFDFRAGTQTLPLHVHVRRWAHDGAVASLLVYAPTRGAWFEGDEMPADVRAFAVDALAVYVGAAPVFSDAAGVRP